MNNFSLPMQWNANPDMVMGDFTPIPSGWYAGLISEMEFKSKKGNPQEGYLQLSIEVTEGEHKGRILFDNLNLWDQGEKAQQFNQRKVNTLCLATGQHQISDLNQLIGKPLMFQVKLQDGREVEDPNTGEVKKYDARNQVTNYKAVSSSQPTNSAPVVNAPAQTQNAPAGMPPPGQTPASTPAQTAPAQQAPATQPPVQNAQQTPANVPAQGAGPAVAGGSVPPWVKQ